MDQKRIQLLVGTLVVLLLAAWLSGYFDGASTTVETPDMTLTANEVDGIDAITIRKDNQIIVVARSADGTWRLKEPVDAEVDTITSAALLDGLSDIRIESLVSSRPDRYEKFQVDSAHATYIGLGGRESVEFFVGKTGPDFQSRYIRIGGDERVFLATGIPAADPSLDRWKNKLRWAHPKEAIKQVSVTTPEATFQVVSGVSGWVIEREGASSPADSAKVERYLDRIASVKADGFLLDVSLESVVDSARYLVEIAWLSGNTSRLRILKRDKDAAAVEDGSDDVIKFLSYRAAALAPEPAELLPD